MLRKGSALPRFAGRAPGWFDPQGATPLLQGGRRTDPGLWIEPGPLSDEGCRNGRRLRIVVRLPWLRLRRHQFRIAGFLEPYAPPPSRAASTRDPRTASVSGGQNPEQLTKSDLSPIQSVRNENTISGTPRSGTPEPEGAGDSEEEIAPSPNMRRVLTRQQEWKMASSGGGSSAISGPTSHSKEGAALKKHRTA